MRVMAAEEKASLTGPGEGLTMRTYTGPIRRSGRATRTRRPPSSRMPNASASNMRNRSMSKSPRQKRKRRASYFRRGRQRNSKSPMNTRSGSRRSAPRSSSTSSPSSRAHGKWSAAWQLANAQMQKQAEQSRDQIAGQLEQLFSDPSKYMQNRAKQMMMDIIANWVQQLEQSNPRMQGILGGLLGQNKMPVGSPRQGIMGLFGTAQHQHGESLGMPTGELGTAGSTLTSAGMTLSSSGTMLMNAAQQISMAASQMGVGNPMASGGFGGLGGSGHVIHRVADQRLPTGCLRYSAVQPRHRELQVPAAG